MTITWKLWTDASSEAKARRVATRLLKQLGADVKLQSLQPYPKLAGYAVTFGAALTAKRWPDCVLEALLLGQRVGRSWMLIIPYTLASAGSD